MNVTNCTRARVSVTELREGAKTYGDMLILHVSQALEDTTTDSVAQVLGGRFRVDVPEIHSPVQPLSTRKALEGIGGEGNVRGHGRGGKGISAHASLNGSEGRGRLSDERLGRGGLSCLCSSLLRLGDIRASVLAIVDAFASPCRLGGKGVHDLS